MTTMYKIEDINKGTYYAVNLEEVKTIIELLEARYGTEYIKSENNTSITRIYISRWQ